MSLSVFAGALQMEPCLYGWLALWFCQAMLQQFDSAEREYFGAQHMGSKGIAHLFLLESRDAPGVRRYIPPKRAGRLTGMEIIVCRLLKGPAPSRPEAGIARKKACKVIIAVEHA